MSLYHPVEKVTNKNLPPQLLDFKNFLYLVWMHLGLPAPTPIQYQIADYLQYGNRRIMIQAFRGVGKSYITVCYVVWLLLLNPDNHIMVVSASKSRADDFSTFAQRLIEEIPILNCLKPKNGQTWSKVAFTVGPSIASGSPSVVSKGITSQLTGSRATHLISDDVEVLQNSDTQVKREKIADAVKEYDAILVPGGRVIWLGTPQSINSIYNQLPDRGYEIRIWPSRFIPADQLEKYGDMLAPELLKQQTEDPSLATGYGIDGTQGAPTDPRRFDDRDLIERELSYGRSGFALQFQLDTALSDADRFPLKISDLVVMDLSHAEAPEKIIWGKNPELEYRELPNVAMRGERFYRPLKVADTWLPYQSAIMSIDPSGRGKDETSYAVVKSLNSQLFVTACGGVSGSGYDEASLRQLAKIAKENQVHEIIIESNFGDGMFTEIFKPYIMKTWPCLLEEIRHNTMKEARIIDTLEPVLNQHRLIMDSRVVQQDYQSTQHLPPEIALRYQLIYQLSFLSRDKGCLDHDDRLDALAMAVARHTERMGNDIDTMIQAQRDALFDREMEDFLGHVFGITQEQPHGEPNWLKSFRTI